MKRETKILLGILSFIPLTTLIIAAPLAIYAFTSQMLEQYPFDTMEMTNNILIASVIGILGLIIGLILLIIFLVISLKDDSASENDKVIWVFALFIFSYLAYPFYWYFRIWKNNDFKFEPTFSDRTN